MFQVGDIIKGNSYNYGITDFNMLKAEVTKLLPPNSDENRPRMVIKIIEYIDDKYIGEKYAVDNDKDDFLLISTAREFETASDEELDLLYYA